MSMKPPVRVIKLGGSLLDLEGLPQRLRAWLNAQPPMAPVMIAGGGPLADTIRDAYRRHALSEEAAHWLCVRILGVTAELVARMMPEAVLVREYESLCLRTGDLRLRVFETEDFLRRVDACRSPVPLPHTWDVTSDSIAARVAEFLSADELVLLKSSDPPPGHAAAPWADVGYVDRYFPCAASGLRVRCVNLRAEP